MIRPWLGPWREPLSRLMNTKGVTRVKTAIRRLQGVAKGYGIEQYIL